MSEPILEPGEREEPPEQEPPEKLEFKAQAFGWLQHVHQEVEELAEMLSANLDEDNIVVVKINHLNDTLDQALRDLALQVPEDKHEELAARAESRRGAMLEHPLPPFPEEDAHRPGPQ